MTAENLDTLARPDRSDYPPFFISYIDQVPEVPLWPLLAAQPEELRRLFSRFDEARAEGGYGPGKWSFKEVVGHLVDADRVFAYRCMAIARGEPAPLPGMDEKLYVEGGAFNRRPLASLLEEYAAQRRASLLLYRGLDEVGYGRRGVANGLEITARAFPFIAAGHHIHHLAILAEHGLG